MKFQKLDKKQVPQLAALGALTLGVFAFAGYSLLSATGGPTAKVAAEPAPAPVEGAPEGSAPEGATPEGGSPEGTAPGTAGQPGVPVGELQLPSIHNDDPFRPAVKPEGPVAVKPAPAPSAPPKAGPRVARSIPDVRFPEIPFPGFGPSAPAPAPTLPPGPPPPVRPDIAVSGIIDAEDGLDMALVALGTEQRIVQVGDLLPNKYRVKKIAMDGILIVNGKDRYFVPLGNKTQAGVPGAAPAEQG